jgi:hypothetical protein
MKKTVFILFLLLFFVGCATTQIVQTKIWENPEVYRHIKHYIKTYGEPPISLHGMNYMNGDEYVELYWEIQNRWYKVQIYKDAKGWEILIDQIKASII